MAGVKKSKVKAGQVCWTTGGHVLDNLNGRLVKVVSVRKNGGIIVRLINPTSEDVIDLGKDCELGYSSDYWLFTDPSDWNPWMEGTPESITQPVVDKQPLTCPSCNSKITAKMKFCAECGEKLK